jgi:four helix bundle protein
VRSHHKLNAWKEAVQLVKRVYEITDSFPQSEIYSLTNQMRRSAISIPSNIAEGAARAGNKELLHFLYISRGSLSELETQVFIAEELGYLDTISRNDIVTKMEKLFGLLGGLINSVKRRAKDQ